jgi:Fur family transcriptional regulator, ferric uptake regulator
MTTMNKSKERVLASLEKADGFMSAQELFRNLVTEGEKIGLTTVYRSLQTLVEKKYVDVLKRDDGESIYRACGQIHHHHLICKRCGTAVEIESDAIEDWAVQVAKKHGFREIDHVAEIYGLCNNC